MIDTRFDSPWSYPSYQQVLKAAGMESGPQNGNAFAPAVPQDVFQPSAELQQAGGPQVLQQFGADRLKAVKTALAASGGKPPQNPEVPWYGKLLMPFIGNKTKTVSKNLGPDQRVTTKFKIKGFKLKDLRLTTTAERGTDYEKLRHIDFDVKRPSNGKRGQVKDVGEILAKGTPRRMFEQEVHKPAAGRLGEIRNTYFDPKTGKGFLSTLEVSARQDKTKFGTVRSKKDRTTYRQIDVLGENGKPAQRYVFDYANKNYRQEFLDPKGNVVGSSMLSKKTDYFKLVDSLSLNPPSSRAAVPAEPARPAPAAQPAPQPGTGKPAAV